MIMNGGWQDQNLWGQQAEDSGNGLCCSSILKAVCYQSFLLLREGQSFYFIYLFLIFRTSSDWMRPNHMMKNHLLYSKSTDANVNLIQNTLTETARIMFEHISEHCSPAKLT